MIFTGAPQLMKGENEMGIKSFIVGLGVGTIAPVVGVGPRNAKTIPNDIFSYCVQCGQKMDKEAYNG